MRIIQSNKFESSDDEAVDDDDNNCGDYFEDGDGEEEDGRIKNVEKYDDTFLEGCISSIEHMLYESGMILGIVIQTAMKDNSVW